MAFATGLFHITASKIELCSAPMRMSPLCQFGMTLPECSSGGVWGDGSDHEQQGTGATGCVARPRSQVIAVTAATKLLGLGQRQVLRLLKAYRTSGADGLIPRQRGRPSSRRKPEEVRSAALSIIGKRFADFGPTLPAEGLRELHDICLGRETVRVVLKMGRSKPGSGASARSAELARTQRSARAFRFGLRAG